MEPAFWDTSALVPLCVPKQASASLHRLARFYIPVVWWATPVEIQSAVARQVRSGDLGVEEQRYAQLHLERLKRKWQEVHPSDSLRSVAEDLLHRYPLTAADALQLAAAYIWSEQRPFNENFICGDRRLLDAAAAVGFRALAIT